MKTDNQIDIYIDIETDIRLDIYTSHKLPYIGTNYS